MKLLLDTHVWIWSQLAPRRIAGKVGRAIESSANELWLSPVSVWEAVLLADTGRLELLPDPISWARRAIEALPLREAPLTHEIALESRRLDLNHDDPADRFLVATAKVLGLTLVTADEQLMRCKQVSVLRIR